MKILVVIIVVILAVGLIGSVIHCVWITFKDFFNALNKDLD